MMPAQKKMRPPKHLEKMLFINHKEDQSLQDRLARIHLRSRLREIELDRERIKVRDELRDSKRKQIPIDNVLARQDTMTSRPSMTSRKPTRLSVTSDPRFPQDEDGPNAYLLGEFKRMSEVIPTILLTLSAKDDKNKPKSGSRYRPEHAKTQSKINSIQDYEPDLHRITKLARTVKTLRHNMAINKKLEFTRPTVSLAKMFKEIYEKEHDLDQYTDGACVLLKRKMEKRRRGPLPQLDQPIRRRHSAYEFSTTEKLNDSSTGTGSDVRESVFPPHGRHSAVLPALKRTPSVANLPRMTRSMSSLSVLGVRPSESPDTKLFIGEDELVMRKRVAFELHRYERLREKVDRFLIPSKAITEVSDEAAVT
ncbi:uncharacterized protein LOC110448361 [Mizuhopecten yessoensis]|uniref:Uncharacterized protein n=1 Tax=Mizuhopecten yessoensis TaxID=6573 RepID=A0A210QTC2_MIZYE|nr:uncharacterized protein LOC110448361 [Mizuhopecten yessoensis]OWF51988.1 hypothetical protein KP79_PYT06670 [Mizuhopecten yessoensis]